MKGLRIFILIGEIVGFIYGVYSELAPDDWYFTKLPDGMGLAIALIAMAMIPQLLAEYSQNETQEKTFLFLEKLCAESGKALAFHESDFYEMWRSQMASAEKNVDVTHLGLKPPSLSHGQMQKDYFENYKKVVKTCPAQVRRVERDTVHKRLWIIDLLKMMNGLKNFSLAIYHDPWEEKEMPAALSVCRIDDKYAWLVAMAEHQSTTEVRDLLITNPQAVALVRAYFQNRLWNGSQVLLEHGNLTQLGEEYMRRHG